jgi:hypothetical protein
MELALAQKIISSRLCNSTNEEDETNFLPLRNSEAPECVEARVLGGEPMSVFRSVAVLPGVALRALVDLSWRGEDLLPPSQVSLSPAPLSQVPLSTAVSSPLKAETSPKLVPANRIALSTV